MAGGARLFDAAPGGGPVGGAAVAGCHGIGDLVGGEGGPVGEGVLDDLALEAAPDVVPGTTPGIGEALAGAVSGAELPVVVVVAALLKAGEDGGVTGDDLLEVFAEGGPGGGGDVEVTRDPLAALEGGGAQVVLAFGEGHGGGRFGGDKRSACGAPCEPKGCLGSPRDGPAEAAALSERVQGGNGAMGRLRALLAVAVGLAAVCEEVGWAEGRPPALLVSADASTYAELNLDRLLGKAPETAALRSVLARVVSMDMIGSALASDEEAAAVFEEVVEVVMGFSEAVGPRLGCAVWIPDLSTLLGEAAMGAGVASEPKVLVAVEVRDGDVMRELVDLIPHHMYSKKQVRYETKRSLRKKTVEIECPKCGTDFRVKKGATSIKCPGCGVEGEL